jgi:hypothetical protein
LGMALSSQNSASPSSAANAMTWLLRTIASARARRARHGRPGSWRSPAAWRRAPVYRYRDAPDRGRTGTSRQPPVVNSRGDSQNQIETSRERISVNLLYTPLRG